MANTFKSYVGINIGTSASTVLPVVASATQTTVIGMTCANTSGGNITVDVTLTKSGGTTAYIVKGASILAGSSIVVIGGDQKVVAQTGDAIQVKSNTAGSVDAIISVLEIA